MKPLLMGFLGVVVGLMALFAGLIATEAFSAAVHPFPADFQGSHDEVCAHVERYPTWVLGVAAGMWALTAHVAVRLASRLGGLVSGIIVAVLIASLLAFNLAMLPYPIWFRGLAGTILPLAMLAAVRRRAKRPSPTPGSEPCDN